MARKYGLGNPPTIESMEDVQMAFNDLWDLLEAVFYGGLQKDGTFKLPLNGLDGDTYLKYDPVEKRVTLFIGGTSSGKWDRA